MRVSTLPFRSHKLVAVLALGLAVARAHPGASVEDPTLCIQTKSPDVAFASAAYFNDSRVPVNGRCDMDFPSPIVNVPSANDVQASIACASQFSSPTNVVNGGNSPEGISNVDGGVLLHMGD